MDGSVSLGQLIDQIHFVYIYWVSVISVLGNNIVKKAEKKNISVQSSQVFKSLSYYHISSRCTIWTFQENSTDFTSFSFLQHWRITAGKHLHQSEGKRCLNTWCLNFLVFWTSLESFSCSVIHLFIPSSTYFNHVLKKIDMDTIWHLGSLRKWRSGFLHLGLISPGISKSYRQIKKVWKPEKCGYKDYSCNRLNRMPQNTLVLKPQHNSISSSEKYWLPEFTWYDMPMH